jgi:sirohydrochlorin cobaltochelatase
MNAFSLPTQAIVLFAHGSRDPLWAQPIQAVADVLRAQLGEQVHVRCAYLELTALSLPEMMAELNQLGVTQLRILPLFLGMGRHAREDLPALIKQLADQYPHVQIELLPSAGESPEVIQALAQAALKNHPS